MRSGFLVLARVSILAVCGAASTGAGAQVIDQAIDATGDATGDATDGAPGWQSFSRVEQLTDGSTLTEYVVRSRAVADAPAQLNVSFSPRFDCEPMIGFVLDSELASVREDDASLSVRIDGIGIDWPDRAVPSSADDTVGTWLYADRQVRRAVRLRIDIGDSLRVQLNPEQSIDFSLLGSRASVRAAEAACRGHEPIPFEL